MGTNRRDAALEDARTDESELFADITASIVEVPTMPDYLAAFDQAISPLRAREDAQGVFQVWLEIDRRPTPLWNHGMDLPCTSDDIIPSFSPDVPDPDDFADGTYSPEYLRLRAVSEIDAAIAKRACSGCPLRIQCLARALRADASYQRGERVEEHGILGGWGPRARAAIEAQFVALRREHQSRVR